MTPAASSLSDGELLDATRAGHGQAFGVLYERRHELVLAFLLKRTHNPEVAMDLMAETFAAALVALARRPPTIRGTAVPWLLAIARNALIDSYRRGVVESAARRRLALEPMQLTDSDIEGVLHVAAEADLLAHLAAELPVDQFEALHARVLEGRGYVEIAQQLRCSPAVVRKRVSRAIATLRQRPADTPMTDFHDAYRDQLVTAASGHFEAPPAKHRTRGMARRRHIPLLVAIALGALLLAAAALAASQIIGTGAPVSASHTPGRGPASASTGVGVPVAGAHGRPASWQLLGISVPDPAGGLPWGMRTVRTTRGLLCLQIGRLMNRRLGVLGRDGQFNNDGLFHELPTTVLDPDTCILPTQKVLYSDSGLAAAGALPGPTRFCLAAGETGRQPAGPRPCPEADLRMVAFGVLGPHAVSVSYQTEGRTNVVGTVGRVGAYLIVLDRPARSSAASGLDAFSTPLGSFPFATQPAILSRITFRFGKHVCQAGTATGPGEPKTCTTSLARTPIFVPEIPRGLHTAIHLTAHRLARGYDLSISFVAPASVFDASTGYGVQVTMPSGAACPGRGGSGKSIERDVAQGRTLRITELIGKPPGCHGTVRGRVILGGQPDSLTGPVSRVETIGRFSFKLP